MLIQQFQFGKVESSGLVFNDWTHGAAERLKVNQSVCRSLAQNHIN